MGCSVDRRAPGPAGGGRRGGALGWAGGRGGGALGWDGGRGGGASGQHRGRGRAVTQATAAHITGAPARVELYFVPAGLRVRVPPGVSLFDAASWNGIAIDSTCGGHGTCKKCKIKVLDGAGPASALDARAFSADELRAGWRLACRALADTDVQVEVPPLVTRPKAATVGVGRQVILRPAAQKRYLELDEPSLSDQRTDIERVLRGADYKVTAVVVDDVLIDVQAGDTTGRLYGLAFDLGTTTVVATLLDL